MSNQPVALWRQLQAAASVLAAVRAGQSATPALAAVEATLRPGVQALVFHVLRNLGRAEALRQRLARRSPPPEADALLCTALALCWREAGAPYESFTLVDQAVEAAKRDPGMRAQAAFVNACLRRFLREREALVAATDSDPVAQWNHPRWWIARLKNDHPTQWQDILRASNEAAPMTLRVNARKSTRADALALLQAAQIEASTVGEQGIVLAKALPVVAIPGFAEGTLSVQDAGAQLAAHLLLAGLDRSTPRRILDACAAPGGKTAHLLELADAEVLALDIDAQRCERIQDNLRRLGLQAQVVVADAGKPADWWDGTPFDAILLDAPCTASGIVRRHPDVRWLRRESDIGQLAAQQAALLAALWPLLRPGGRLLYCTCSVFRAEGQQPIQTFVAHNKDAVLRPSPGHLIPQSGAKGKAVPDNAEDDEPPRSALRVAAPRGGLNLLEAARRRLNDHDGFYYALLEKQRAAVGQASPEPLERLADGA